MKLALCKEAWKVLTDPEGRPAEHSPSTPKEKETTTAGALNGCVTTWQHAELNHERETPLGWLLSLELEW